MAEIHSKFVRVGAAELQRDLLSRVALYHQLEVLNRGLGHPSVEIQHERLNLNAPANKGIIGKGTRFRKVLEKVLRHR